MSVFVPILMVITGLIWVFWRSKREKAYYGQTIEPPSPPAKPERTVRDTTGEDQAPEELSLGKRIGAIAFFSVWLTAWTFGCYVALISAAELQYGEEGYIFLRVWLALAIPAWFFVAWTLVRLVRGDNVEFSMDGDADADGGGD